jgi:4-amino-4-deoxy-L-arabinose transferase-like glycosyltransferase
MRRSRTAILIVAVAVLAGGLFFAGTERVNRNDAALYYQLAVNVAAGNGLSMATAPPHNWIGSRESLYPLLLAIPFRIFGPGLGVVFGFNVLLHALTALLVWRIGRDLGGEKAGMVAGLATAVFPTLANYTVYALRETCFTFLLVAAVFLTMRAMDTRTVTMVAFAGLVWGAAALCRSVVLPFAFIAVVIVVAGTRPRGLAAVARGAILAVGCAAVLVGWGMYARPYERAMEDPKRVDSAVGGASARAWKNFYTRVEKAALSPDELKMYTVYSLSESLADRLYPGNHLRSVGDGYFYRAYGHKMAEFRREGLSEREINARIRADAIALLKAHPVQFAVTSLHELVKFNSFFQVPLVNEPAFAARAGEVGPAVVRGVTKLAGFVILGFAGVGMWRLGRRAVVPVAVVVYFNVLHTGLDSIGRYAAPVVPFYLAFAAIVLCAWQKDRVVSVAHSRIAYRNEVATPR